MTTEELLQSLKKILEDSFTWKIPEENKWNDWVDLLQETTLNFIANALGDGDWHRSFAALNDEDRYYIVEIARLSAIDGAYETCQILQIEAGIIIT